MPLRVALIGTAGVGGHALRAVLGNREYELAGVWVSSDAKAGRDAGDLCPEWSRAVSGSYACRIEITGEPSYSMDFNLSSRDGDHAHAGMVATASRVVNDIPAVVAATPAIATTLDLPLPSGRGLFRRA